MDIKEFAQELQDSAKTTSEMGNTDYEIEIGVVKCFFLV